MSDKSRKKGAALPPDSAEEGGENERPTLNPPFDVEEFARVASSPSGQPSAPSDVPTRPPPPAAPGFGPDEAKTERITLTNEIELERARARSAKASPMPRTYSAGALSIADARSPSSPSVPATSNPALAAPASSIEAAVLGAIGGSSPPEITERTIEDPVAEMRERFSLGDYTGALEMSELILADDPDHVEAAECGQNCRTVLENMYAARLGPLDRVPMVLVPRTQMRWLTMDHRAGFILSLIDGSSTVEMVLDLSGMSKLDALRILHDLVQQKIVAFR